MKGTHGSSSAILYMMFFSLSVYFEWVRGPSSSDPEEHKLRSGLWPVLGLACTALVLVGFFPFWVSLVFLGGVEDKVLPDC